MSGLRRGKQGHYSRSAKLRRGSPTSTPIKRRERQSLHRVCKVYRRSCELVCWTHPRHSHSAWIRAFPPRIHFSLCNPSLSPDSASLAVDIQVTEMWMFYYYALQFFFFFLTNIIFTSCTIIYQSIVLIDGRVVERLFIIRKIHLWIVIYILWLVILHCCFSHVSSTSEKIEHNMEI